MFDSALAEKLEAALGLAAVLSVSAAAAPTFVGSILCPGVLQGIVLGEHLVLLFHRTKGGTSAPADAAGEFLRGNEAALWVKPAGAKEFRPARPGDPIRAGDGVVGAWWRRLT